MKGASASLRRSPSRWTVALAAVFILSWSDDSRAEPPVPPGSAAARLTPPRAISAGVVPYPAGATARARVTIELVVDPTGRVTDARLLEGEAPFTVVTMEAAWGWRFAPAERDGHPIAARIRMRADFVPPAIVARQTAPSATAADLTEVHVRGRRSDPALVTLGRGDVRQLPGAFGDAFRAIEALPGPTPMASGLPYYFIRGAPPGDTGYLIDGVKVPFLFHAAFGPSVIHPSLIEHLDFFPGDAPVQYGRYAGGVLSASLPLPATQAHAEGIVRAFDAGALVEAPFADDGGTALVAGRYSYSGAILSAISPLKLAYWDYQARATWKIDDKNQVGIFAFGSYDDFAQIKGGITDTIIDGEFHRVDVRLDHTFESGTLRVAATLGYARSNNDNNDIRDLTLGLRASFEGRVSDTLHVRAGADITVDRYDLLANLNDPYVARVTDILYPPHVDVAIGGYVDAVWQISPRVQLVPGLRADLYASHRYDDPSAELAAVTNSPAAVATSILPSVDPRLAARFDVHERVTLVSTIGVAQQPASFLVPVPGLSFVQPDPVLQTAVQMSEGATLALPLDLTFQATGFLHTYLNLSDLTATCPSVFGAGVLLGNAPNVMNNLCLTERVRGQAFGGEFLLRRKLGKRLSGWVSYTLSRSTREAAPVGNALTSGVVTTLASFDRTHVVNVVASVDLGGDWRAGARLVAYSGLPYTNTRQYVLVPPYNGARMPAFYRVDVRVEKRWKVGPRGTVAVVLEGMNVTLDKEVLGTHCAPVRGQSARSIDPCTFETLGPVSVPSLGVEGTY